MPSSSVNEDKRKKYNQTYAQCTSQLYLTRIVSDIVANQFDNLLTEQLNILKEALENVEKFTKEFNSEEALRFKLFKQGYQAHLNELPGLLSSEEESQKVYLSILFKQFFKEKQKTNKKLFDNCSKVLKDYVFKHSELVSIKSAKQGKNFKLPADLHTLVEEQMPLLHELELEKQIYHQS